MHLSLLIQETSRRLATGTPLSSTNLLVSLRYVIRAHDGTGQLVKERSRDGGRGFGLACFRPPPPFVWRREYTFCKANPPTQEEPAEKLLHVGGHLGGIWPWPGFPSAGHRGSLDSHLGGGHTWLLKLPPTPTGIPADVAHASSGPKVGSFVTLPGSDSAGTRTGARFQP